MPKGDSHGGQSSVKGAEIHNEASARWPPSDDKAGAPSMKIAIITATLAAALLMASPARADVITLTPSDVGDTFSLDYNGFTGSGVVDGLNATIAFTLQAVTGSRYVFGYSLANTSSDPVQSSRVSGFGFDTNPELRGASSTGAFSIVATDGNVPNIGRVDVCFKDGGGSNSCAGGGGGGVSLGDAAGTGTLTLNFLSPVSSLTLSDFFVRYQSISGAGSTTSAVGSGTVSSTSGGNTSGGGTSSGGTPVPEPAMLGLFGLGVAGLAFARRRQRQAPVRAAA